MCRLGPNSDKAALATHQVDRETLRPWIFDLIDSYIPVKKALSFDGFDIEPEAGVGDDTVTPVTDVPSLTAPSPGTSSSPAAASSAMSGAEGKGKSTSSESSSRLIEDIKGLIERARIRRGRETDPDVGEDSTRSPPPLLTLHLGSLTYIRINSEDCVELQQTDPDIPHDMASTMPQLLLLEFPAEISSESTWCGLIAPALDLDSEKEGYLLSVMANRRAMPMRIRTTEGDELYIFACKDIPEAQQLHAAAMKSPDGVKDPWRPDFRVDLEGDCGSYRDRKLAEKATRSWRGFQHHRLLACSTVGSSGTTTI